MRDFYDIHSLLQWYGENMNPVVFNQALMATANKRGAEHYLNDMLLIEMKWKIAMSWKIFGWLIKRNFLMQRILPGGQLWNLSEPVCD
jgi:hypothetical protein